MKRVPYQEMVHEFSRVLQAHGFELDDARKAALADGNSAGKIGTFGGEVYFPGERSLKSMKENMELSIPVIEEIWDCAGNMK